MIRHGILLGFGFLLSLCALLCAQRADSQAQYSLKPTPKTVVWGYYDAKAAPVLRVKSGDTVEIQTLITSSPKRLEDAGVAPADVEQSLRDITTQVTDKGPGATSSPVRSSSKTRRSATCWRCASRKFGLRFLTPTTPSAPAAAFSPKIIPTRK